MEEYEKRLIFVQYLQTLIDAVDRLSPITRIPSVGKGETEDPTLRENRQLLTQEWMGMYRDFLKKIKSIGTDYPIEDVLGIAKSKETSK